ncbi:MAG: hypothetical protein B6D61_14100 [Bacteroidetes bacterium 4484_249]|nr:MAG: hypothetical protein B6D61_14100 [Bacteroidetes bacterium 4484_249]
MKIVFFRTPKPKQFKYPPRYYDEEKERWERRRKELGIGENGKKTDFKSQVGSRWRRLRKTDNSRQKKANMSVIIYLLIVAMLIYFVFFA